MRKCWMGGNEDGGVGVLSWVPTGRASVTGESCKDVAFPWKRRQAFFSVRVVKERQWFAREALECPSLALLKR